MKLYVLPAGPIQTNAYLLTAPDRGEAVLIDAPDGIWAQIQPLLTKDRCELAELWVTHGHWDHTQGAAEVVRETDATVRAHPDDQVLIETPEVMRAFLDRRMTIEPVKVDAWVRQGDEIDALGCTFEVRHVPGHCPGNIMFYSAAMQGAFVGDALFRGSIGRTDLPGGDFDQLEAAIRQQIYSLPDETKIYPGHGPATTVGTERRTNPHVHD